MNSSFTTNWNLINATKRAQYLLFLADREQKITEKKTLYAKRRWAIKGFCVDFRRILLHVAQKKRDITKPQAFLYDALNHIQRIYTTGGHNSYKKTFQQVKKGVFGISKADVQWLLEHCQVCIMNKQNTTRSFLQPIVVTKGLGRVQADLIDICTKPDGKHMWIPHWKDHFSKFRMQYALTNKRPSEITYYISLFVHRWGVSGILLCDNAREFKRALLLFL